MAVILSNIVTNCCANTQTDKGVNGPRIGRSWEQQCLNRGGGGRHRAGGDYAPRGKGISDFHSEGFHPMFGSLHQVPMVKTGHESSCDPLRASLRPTLNRYSANVCVHEGTQTRLSHADTSYHGVSHLYTCTDTHNLIPLPAEPI